MRAGCRARNSPAPRSCQIGRVEGGKWKTLALWSTMDDGRSRRSETTSLDGTAGRSPIAVAAGASNAVAWRNNSTPERWLCCASAERASSAPVYSSMLCSLQAGPGGGAATRRRVGKVRTQRRGKIQAAQQYEDWLDGLGPMCGGVKENARLMMGKWALVG